MAVDTSSMLHLLSEELIDDFAPDAEWPSESLSGNTSPLGAGEDPLYTDLVADETHVAEAAGLTKEERRKNHRLEKNRLSAHASRQRKKELLSSLKTQYGELQANHATLSTRMTTLESENARLKQEARYLKAVLKHADTLSGLVDSIQPRANALRAKRAASGASAQPNNDGEASLCLAVSGRGDISTARSTALMGPALRRVCWPVTPRGLSDCASRCRLRVECC